ncbi:hypothetical protein QL676_004740 [Escherichia coli]|nr:hypothetical protein [Escherichia coli]ELW5365895.1 hypothetical protein [Escherichia coli]
MMNQNKEFLGNLMLEITKMKERMVAMESEIKSLKADNKALRKSLKLIDETKEGANKQVISSQADSLIKISRIWADFFPANTSNQPI